MEAERRVRKVALLSARYLSGRQELKVRTPRCRRLVRIALRYPNQLLLLSLSMSAKSGGISAHLAICKANMAALAAAVRQPLGGNDLLGSLLEPPDKLLPLGAMQGLDLVDAGLECASVV